MATSGYLWPRLSLPDMLSSCQSNVRPIFEMKWWPRAFSRVSTGDSVILSSCDINDEHASFHNVMSSYIIMVHYQNRETDVGTLL